MMHCDEILFLWTIRFLSFKWYTMPTISIQDTYTSAPCMLLISTNMFWARQKAAYPTESKDASHLEVSKIKELASLPICSK